MKVKAGESMEKEGGELVQAVEDHAVVPHDDGGHEAPHAQHIVSLGRIVIGVTHNGSIYLVPAKIVRIKTSLQDDTQVHEVAEVNHEELILGSTVLNIPGNIFVSCKT